MTLTDVVPESWPAPPAEPPVRAKPLAWWQVPPAVLAAPFVPRWLGPRLSVSSWPKALAAQLVALSFGVGLISLAVLWINEGLDATPLGWSNLTWSERVRLPFALLVYVTYLVTENLGDIYGVFGVIAAAHVLCWPAGMIVMPFVAAGERTRTLFLRAVKLLLWSSTWVVPVALLVLGVAYVNVRSGVQLRDTPWTADIAAPALAGAIWWLSVVLRLGARCAGADRRPRLPRCRRCGYTLTGLPLDGRCPECGHPVRASNPAFDEPTPWAEASGLLAKPMAYWRTARRIDRDREFIHTVALDHSCKPARRFAYTTAGVTAFLGMFGGAVLCAGDVYVSGIRTPRAAEMAVILVAVGLAHGALLLFCTLLVATAVGLSNGADMRATGAAAGYASFLLLPGFACMAVAVDAGFLAQRLGIGIGSISLSWDVTVSDPARYVIAGFVGVGAVLAGLGGVRMLRAVHAARFAGA